MSKGRRQRQPKGAKKCDSKQVQKGQCVKCGKVGHVSKDCNSKETAAFEMDEEGFVETSVRGKPRAAHWNRLMCSSDSVPEDSGGRLPRCSRHQAKQRATGQRGTSCAGPRCKKVQVKLKDECLRCVNPGVTNTHRALMAVSEMNDMGRDVFFQRSDRGIEAYTKLELHQVRVPRGQWHEAGARSVNGVSEMPVDLVPCLQSTSKPSNIGA